MRVPNSELQLLQVLWSDPRQTPRQITESLNTAGKAVGLSSVQTLLRRLEARGLVKHEADGRTFCYSATCDPGSVRAAHARDLLDRMFEGTLSGFVTQLMDEEKISDTELRELVDLVEAKLKERKSQ